MPYEEVEISRDVEVVMIPQGVTSTLKAGTPAVITQALGDSFTLQVPTFGGLYRLSGKDADAIGKAAARGGEPGADLDAPVTRAIYSAALRPRSRSRSISSASARLRSQDRSRHRRQPRRGEDDSSRPGAVRARSSPGRHPHESPA
jgi:hypothetical protein